MEQLPVHPQRGREAPGYALDRRLSRLGSLPAEVREDAFHLTRQTVVFETLRLTGASVDKEVVDRLAAGRRANGGRTEGDALVLGQLEALETVEARAKGERSVDLDLIREVHRRANPPSEGSFRSEDIKPQFRNARPSPPRFVAARLSNLLDWLWAESGRAMFPAERMSLWFPRFLEIAPFEHGNFRTAHLLLSFFACAQGYPPVSLRLSESEEIRAEIERALNFDTYPLVQRFSEAISRSLSTLEETAEGRQ